MVLLHCVVAVLLASFVCGVVVFTGLDVDPHNPLFFHPDPATCRPRPWRTQALNPDSYRVGNFSFPIKTWTEYGQGAPVIHEYDTIRTILAQCGWIARMEVFDQRLASNRTLLTWRQLQTACGITSFEEGSSKGNGWVHVNVEPYTWHAYPLDSEKFGPMGIVPAVKAKKARVLIEYSRGIPEGMFDGIKEGIEKIVLCLVNSELKDMLKHSVKCTHNGLHVSCKYLNGRSLTK